MLTILGLTLKIGFVATTITLLCAIFLAHWFDRLKHNWTARVLEGLISLPMVLPPAAIGYGSMLLLGANGPLQFLYPYFGINSLVFTWIAGVFVSCIIALPIMYQNVRIGIKSVQPILLDSARIQGASESDLFFRIVLPLAFPKILVGISLSFARIIGEFGATIFVMGNIPGKTQTLSTALYYAVETGDRHNAATLFWLALAIGALIVWFINLISDRYIRDTHL